MSMQQNKEKRLINSEDSDPFDDMNLANEIFRMLKEDDDEQRNAYDSSRGDGDDADNSVRDFLDSLDISGDSFDLDHDFSLRARCAEFGSKQFYPLLEIQLDDILASDEYEFTRFEEPRNHLDCDDDCRDSKYVHAAVSQRNHGAMETCWNEPNGFTEVCKVPYDDMPTVIPTIEPTSHPLVVRTSRGLALLLNNNGSNTVSFPRPHQEPDLRTLKKPLNVPSNTDRKFQRWSEEEDEILKQAVQIEKGPPINWKRIAQKYFSNVRTGLQCKSRWTKSLQPGIVRGAWKPDEDACILKLQQAGLKWSAIADYLPGRLGEHVRDRFVNVLDPNLKKTPWTPEEDEILYQEQRRIGNKWTQISKVISGRSENSVKNRWHNLKMTNRRKLRKATSERKRKEQCWAEQKRTQYEMYSASPEVMPKEPLSMDGYSSTMYGV
eukprot:scaffold2271_cov130-Cylindrotheca_fusiformis.AAC.5